jgi:hypothetical protein
MSLHRVQLKIPSTTAVSADAVVNTWHFDLTDPAVAGPKINGALDTFYTAWQGYRGNTANWAGATMKMYDLEDAMPRVPVYEAPVVISASSTTGSLPQEVALCLSFQATAGSGLNQKRRRNRVYLGPLAPSACDTGGRPTTSFQTDVDTAIGIFLTNSNSDADWSWAIFSTFWTPPAAPPLVNNGWTDNAFDTQRRRGVAATSRNTFP